MVFPFPVKQVQQARFVASLSQCGNPTSDTSQGHVRDQKIYGIRQFSCRSGEEVSINPAVFSTALFNAFLEQRVDGHG